MQYNGGGAKWTTVIICFPFLFVELCRIFKFPSAFFIAGQLQQVCFDLFKLKGLGTLILDTMIYKTTSIVDKVIVILKF